MHLPLSQWKSTGEQVGSTAGEKSAQQVSSGKQTNKQANKVQIREEKICLLNQHLKASLLAGVTKALASCLLACTYKLFCARTQWVTVWYHMTICNQRGDI